MKMKDKITDKIMGEKIKRTVEDGWEDNGKSVKFDLNRNQIYEIAKRSSIIFEDADNTDDDFEFYEMCFRNNNNIETKRESQEIYEMEGMHEMYKFDGMNYIPYNENEKGIRIEGETKINEISKTGTEMKGIRIEGETKINEISKTGTEMKGIRTEVLENSVIEGIERINNLNNNIVTINGLYEENDNKTVTNNEFYKGFRIIDSNNNVNDLSIVIEPKENSCLTKQSIILKDNKSNPIENNSGVIKYNYPKIKENPFIKNDRERQGL